MGWMIPAAIAAGSVMGGLGGKQKAEMSKQPTTTKFNQTSQLSPFDFDPSTPGNQGVELLASLLGSWSGLLGNLGPSQQTQQFSKTLGVGDYGGRVA